MTQRKRKIFIIFSNFNVVDVEEENFCLYKNGVLLILIYLNKHNK